MADITTARKNTDRQDGEILSFLQGAEKIVEGAIVTINAAGYAINGGDDANTVFAGVADETVDNSAGNAGDTTIKVRRTGVFTFTAAFSAAQSDVNTLAYISDNQSVDLVGTTTNDVLVGRIVEVISSSKVRVDIRDRV